MRASLLRLSLTTALLGLMAPGALAAPPKIGVLLKGRTAFWSAAEKGALAAGAKLGVEILVKAPVSETDVSVQIQMLNALAAQGITALVIAPSNKEALAAPVAALAAKGVKIVVIDSPLSGDVASVFVATDHQAAGVAAGQLLSTLVGETDELCLFKHTQNGGATGQREMGALSSLHDTRPKAAIHGEFFSSTEKGAEPEKASLLLATYPHVKGILASSTPGTLAMLRVLQEKRPPGEVKLVGFGFNLNPEVAAALESGALQGWVAQLPQDIAAKGVACAVALLNGEPVTPVTHTDFVVVTKDNLNKPEVQALLAL